MSVIRLTPDRLAAQLRRDAREFPGEVLRGLKAGAHRGRRMLVRATPRVYTGQLKASWVLRERGRTGPELTNVAPHAGIVERGARPHAVSAEGMAALERWAHLVLGLNDNDAKRAAWAIAQKFRREGQRGTFYVRDSLGKLRDLARAEVERVIGKHHRGGGNG